jgi:Uma2 family endonuclease
MATKTRMTLEEFLALPEEKPYLEYVDGEVCPKTMPTDRHGELAAELLFRLKAYLQAHPVAVARTEVRHYSERANRSYLPDVEVTLNERVRKGEARINPVPEPPDVAIEVISPDDRASRVLDRVNFYLAEGVQVLWVVDPETETVTEYRSSEHMRTLRRGDALESQDLLPGFVLPLAELFDAAP